MQLWDLGTWRTIPAGQAIDLLDFLSGDRGWLLPLFTLFALVDSSTFVNHAPDVGSEATPYDLCSAGVAVSVGCGSDEFF